MTLRSALADASTYEMLTRTDYEMAAVRWATAHFTGAADAAVLASAAQNAYNTWQSLLGDLRSLRVQMRERRSHC